MRFSFAEAEHLAYFGSDHRPILLVLKKNYIPNMKNLPKRFTFEHKWFMEEDFSNYIKTSWDDSNGAGDLLARLSMCSGAVKMWAGSRFDQLARKLHGLR